MANTFNMDFKIAEVFGTDAIKDTFRRAFSEWKSDCKMLTGLCICMNERCWLWHKKNDDWSKLYADYYYKTRDYALDHLKGDDFQYFWSKTD